MRLAGWACLIIAGFVVLGCSSPSGGSGTGGSGGSSSSSGTAQTSSTTVTSSSGTGGSGPTFQPSGFSWSGKAPGLSTDVVPITSPNCGTSAGCHLAMQSGGELYNQFVNVIAEECLDLRMMIKPGDPEHSYVINKLTGKNLCNPATTMPLDQPMLPASDIQVIYDWIAAGASDN